MQMPFILILSWLCVSPLSAQISLVNARVNTLKVNELIVPGAEQPERYLQLLEGKRIGVVANHSSMVKGRHLVDMLLDEGVTVNAVFSPEHGFRGDAGAGEQIKDDKDPATGIPIYSLYGKTKKPTPAMLTKVDLLVFDMQDVGARFYTYLSTLHYVMEAAAENDIPLVVLDRPNPNGFYTDGPVLNLKFQSFVGMHPIPLVHGMTLGELALMIRGEKWLSGGVEPELTIIPCTNYRKSDLYILPHAPSPNLASMQSVYLYPSLCLFEPTVVSIGRGTERAFEVYGHPDVHLGSFSFIPTSMPGKALHPKHEGKTCYGQDIKAFGDFYFQTHRQLYLDWLIASYEKYSEGGKTDFFTSPEFFDKLAGTDVLRKQIVAGMSFEDIRKSWAKDIDRFIDQRQPYLLYE